MQYRPMNIPPGFDTTFLLWLRSTTEEAWKQYTFQEPQPSRLVVGPDWVAGTRWLGGLGDDIIAQVEETWHVTFPPQYRLFLRHLHALDRPQVVRMARDGHMELKASPAFYNWQSDSDLIAGAFNAPIEGILFDVRINDLWLPSWGTRPSDVQAQIAIVRDLAEQAPRLIPTLGHRYLVEAKHTESDLVLSVAQSDIIVIAPSLRTFLLQTFQRLLHLPSEEVKSEGATAVLARAARIPFWGEIFQRRLV